MLRRRIRSCPALSSSRYTNIYQDTFDFDESNETITQGVSPSTGTNCEEILRPAGTEGFMAGKTSYSSSNLIGDSALVSTVSKTQGGRALLINIDFEVTCL
ncbi:unnamed protein product [Rotaria sp. Silwood1]|nr:unnamed protein product [Rotaria sp. Silwood1]